MRFVSSVKLAFGLALLLPAYAQAQVWRAADTVGIWGSVGTAETSYALDGMGTVKRACGLRRQLTSYTTNKLVRLRRTSDDVEADIGFTATGAIDTAAAATHCDATTCFVRTCYDQSASPSDFVQATAANQLAFIFNCHGSAPCLRTTASNQALSTASMTPATGVLTLNVVANRSAGTGGCVWLRANGNNNRLIGTGSANLWVLHPSSTFTLAASDATWHSVTGVINGAASVASIDGVETTGTVTGNTTAGNTQLVGVASTTCDAMELVVFDNIVMPAATRAMLKNNQRSWWGF